MNSAYIKNGRLWLSEESEETHEPIVEDSAPSLVLDSEAGPVDLEDSALPPDSSSLVPPDSVPAPVFAPRLEALEAVSLTFVSGSVNADTGTGVSTGTRVRTSYVSVSQNGTYRLNISGSAAFDLQVFHYDDAQGYVLPASGWVDAQDGYTLTVPDNVHYLRIAVRKKDDSAITPADITTAELLLLGEETGGGSTSTGEPDRPFMTTPLDDYNVTEGLLLLVFCIAALTLVITAFKGRR